MNIASYIHKESWENTRLVCTTFKRITKRIADGIVIHVANHTIVILNKILLYILYTLVYNNIYNRGKLLTVCKYGAGMTKAHVRQLYFGGGYWQKYN